MVSLNVYTCAPTALQHMAAHAAGHSSSNLTSSCHNVDLVKETYIALKQRIHTVGAVTDGRAAKLHDLEL